MRTLIAGSALLCLLVVGCGDSRRYVEEIWESRPPANSDDGEATIGSTRFAQIVLYDNGEAVWVTSWGNLSSRARLARHHRWDRDEKGPYLIHDDGQHHIRELTSGVRVYRNLGDDPAKAEVEDVPFTQVYRVGADLSSTDESRDATGEGGRVAFTRSIPGSRGSAGRGGQPLSPAKDPLNNRDARSRREAGVRHTSD
jgi:hypothetical protein